MCYARNMAGEHVSDRVGELESDKAAAPKGQLTDRVRELMRNQDMNNLHRESAPFSAEGFCHNPQ